MRNNDLHFAFLQDRPNAFTVWDCKINIHSKKKRIKKVLSDVEFIIAYDDAIIVFENQSVTFAAKRTLSFRRNVPLKLCCRPETFGKKKKTDKKQ